MELVRFPARHVPNPRAARDAPYGPRQSEVITLPDEAAAEAMRLLAAGVDGEPRLVSGESGCAAVAGLVAAALDSGLREAIGLDDDARVIAIGSEGATDPETFERVVGRPWEEVRE